MKIHATIQKQNFVALIDSGSTHNFISERLPNSLQLPVVPTSPFQVKVANGDPMRCRGRFEDIPVLLNNISF